MTSRVQPDKIVLAREARGLTQAELARLLNISQGKVSKIEVGMLQMSDDLVSRLSTVLQYPEELFCITDPVLGAGPTDLYHRKRQSTSAKLMKKVYAQINLRRYQITRLLRAFSPPDCLIPRYSEDEGYSESGVAAMVRAMWHMPRGPVPNVTELLERAGAIIVPCNFGTPLIDGMSQWIPGYPPMFFINQGIPRSRYRMTLCHELGHLVMHQTPHPEMENQANFFAAAFLMPGDDIRGALRVLEGVRRVDDLLGKLAHLKLIWRVAMQAILMRARELGVVSASMAQSAFKRISQLRIKKHEPYEDQLPIEQPMSIRHLVTKHINELGYSVGDLAKVALLSTEEFRQTYLPVEAGHLRAV